MTLLLSDDDVRAVADMGSCIGSVEQALLEQREGSVVLPPRINLALDGTFLRLMPVQLGRSDVMGYKTFHGSIERGVRYLVVLCRLSDGKILALVDAAYLTALRTGATSGVATRYMAPSGPATVAVIGSGLEAETNLEAVAAVRPITSVRVFSPRQERRDSFASRMASRLGVGVEAVGSVSEAVAEATIVVIATNTGNGGPVAFEGAWLQAGQHVVSIGSTGPTLREIDADTFARADRVVLDIPVDHMADESGDVMSLSGDAVERLRGADLLADVVAGPPLDRPSGQISLFKSVGTAVQDLAAAKACFESAMAMGVGTDLGELVALKEFHTATQGGQR